MAEMKSYANSYIEQFIIAPMKDDFALFAKDCEFDDGLIKSFQKLLALPNPTVEDLEVCHLSNNRLLKEKILRQTWCRIEGYILFMPPGIKPQNYQKILEGIHHLGSYLKYVHFYFSTFLKNQVSC